MKTRLSANWTERFFNSALPIAALCTLLFGLTRTEASGAETVGAEGNGNHVVGPDYKIDPDLTDRGNPKGRQFEFSMKLADSKVFPGADSTLDPKKPVRKERKIVVYVPAAYRDGTKASLLVTLDGPSRLNLVRNALDNLTISKDPKRRLPPFVVVAVENGGNDGKGSQRGLEYDTMSDRFARFINDEVLPAVLAHPELKALILSSPLPTTLGQRRDGVQFRRRCRVDDGLVPPRSFPSLNYLFRTFVDQQDDDAPEEAQYPLGAWEYHSGKKLIETSEKKPLRIFTHVAENDLRANDPEETYHNWVMANERTAAALRAKGYDYRYVFSRASRHCDNRVYEQTLADTLVWMWSGHE
jgi:enterochelin esterase family protein